MPRAHIPHRTTRILLALILAMTAGLGSVALAAPVAPPPAAPPGSNEVVRLSQSAISVPTDGTFRLQVVSAIDGPTSYFESRVQVRLPSGRLLYQKTEVRSDLDTGTVTIDYERDLKDLSIAPGAYPIEVRVRSQSSQGVREWVTGSQLLVHAPEPTRVPVVIVAYLCAAPSLGADGRFTLDPATSTRARDDAAGIARAVLDDPDRRITLAVPGFLLEEWLLAAGGYEIASPEGVREVAAGTPSAREYAYTLDVLRQALETDRLEMATVPYGAPDVGALQVAGRLNDLTDHLLRGRSAHLSVLGVEPSAILASPGGLVPASALESVNEHDAVGIVLAPESLATTDTPTSSGAFALRDAGALAALVTDTAITAALRSSEASGVISGVFERSISSEASSPIIATVTLGPGQAASSDSVDASLAALEGASWARLVTASQAASLASTETVALAAEAEPLPGAPSGYWGEITASREYAHAFLETVGVNDPDAQAASDLSLRAQSGTWAGPDLNWGSADRGRSLGAASLRISGAVLDNVTLGASEITLSGTGGEVPVSIMNSSEKNLTLSIRTRSSGLDVAESMPATAQVRPQENFVTVPVDLGQSLSGRLTVAVYAGDVLLDEVTVTVRASFLDRLVLVFGVAVVLVGMLLFIRKRVRTADRADTIRTE